MADKFEDNIEQQLSNFSLPPSSLVWQEVEAALHPPTKKRVLIWWWLPLLVVVVGGLGYWGIMEKKGEDKGQEKKMTDEKMINGSKQEHKEQVNKIQVTKGQVYKTQESKVQVYKKQVETLQNATTTNDTILLQVSNQQVAKLPIEKLQDAYVQENKHPINKQQVEKLPMTSDSSLAKAITINNNAFAKDTVAMVASKTTTPPTIDSAVATKKAIQIKSKAKKLSHWVITAGVGTLQTSSGDNFNKALFSNNSSVGSGVGSAANRTLSLSNPKTGINLHVGMAYNIPLSKHWQLQTGLQYRYLTNKHGLKSDTSALFPNSYIADNNNFIANQAHLLQMPVSFIYNLQPAKKNQFNIVMGTSLAYALSEKWLVSNASTGRYYYDASANNKWLFGVHGGLSYSFNQKFTIAALAAYNTTPIHKNVTENYHFIQYNVQVSTPINFKKQSSTKK